VLRAVLLPRGSLGVIPPDARLVYGELQARLRPFVARRVSSPADVDDVLQEVFLRMQRGLPGLRDEQRFGPWVYQVARHAIADHHRAQARHPVPVGEVDEPDQAVDEDGSEIEQVLSTYAASLVVNLPSPYREALTLTELQGLTQAEAAEQVGISISGMKSRVQRGREQIRALMDACCQIGLDARGRVITCEPRAAGRGCRCG